ncbi:6758_t:CDS:2, partial [Dentiscutata heterogama]
MRNRIKPQLKSKGRNRGVRITSGPPAWVKDLLNKNPTWLKFPHKNGGYILFGGENNLQVL